MRIRLAKGFWTSRFGLGLLAFAGIILLVGAGVFTYTYVHFARIIDERLSGQVFQNTSRVFAAPRRIAVGQEWTSTELAAYLQRAGYTESEVAGALGQFRKRPAVGFSDCLMLEIARKSGQLPLGTFDRNLGKLDGAQRL